MSGLHFFEGLVLLLLAYWLVTIYAFYVRPTLFTITGHALATDAAKHATLVPFEFRNFFAVKAIVETAPSQSRLCALVELFVKFGDGKRLLLRGITANFQDR